MSAAADLNRIQALLQQLQHKLQGFDVLDRDGLLLGHVIDVIVHRDTYISLVVQQTAGFPDPHPFLVNSKLIVNLDVPQRSLQVDLDIPTVRYLPSYSSAEMTDLHSNEHASATQPEAAASHHQEGVPHPENLPGVEEKLVQLLAERLVVNTHKRKVGEVVVRKVIETDIIQVPVRREKLIVEQVSPEPQELAVIDLRGNNLEGVELQSPQSVVKGEFHSLEAVRSLLDRLAQQPDHGCETIRLELVINRPNLQPIYQDWMNQQ